MPKRPSSDEVVKVLRRHDFVLVSQKGSHAKYRKVGNPTRTVIVPMGRKPRVRRRGLRTRTEIDCGDTLSSDPAGL